ncbi:MAG: hypothetical protein WBA46_17500, partial [Thermomicrobiales bacterium]
MSRIACVPLAGPDDAGRLAASMCWQPWWREVGMRFGVCVSPERTAGLDVLAGEARPDFVEWSVAGTVGTLDAEAFARLPSLAATLPFTPETWNVLLPGSLKIVGPDADLAALRTYAEPAFARVAALGGTLCVFGSGGARTIPPGWDPGA